MSIAAKQCCIHNGLDADVNLFLCRCLTSMTWEITPAGGDVHQAGQLAAAHKACGSRQQGCSVLSCNALS